MRVLRGSAQYVTFLLSRLCQVPLHMSPQRTWVRTGKVTLVAFVWLFTTVRFQMFPQITWMIRGIVTLVAFVWLFSTVHLQMCPQLAWMRRYKGTLVTYVWFNDIASCFLQDCHIFILQTKIIIFKILLHCHCVLCFAQIVASNWVNFFHLILVSNDYNCLVFHDILSLFQNWTQNVLVGANTRGKFSAEIAKKEKCHVHF